ncbi:MAG: class I mannose-6-phosphate isomerase [Lachnospiraceae bacterium]|nr:class I mannose-6-phosphate isomerase [Lachnospiraceae bacterium]
MTMLRLKPGFKDYIWGGRRLMTEFQKDFEGERLAESWELSCYPDCPSTIINGDYAGHTLSEYIEAEGREVLGKNCANMDEFPILIKFLDTGDRLSVQVHPNDDYARTHEGQNGKTEMWYILDAEPGAFIYYGFSRDISREEFLSRVETQTLTEVLYPAPVKKGDVLYCPPGTLHGIGKGILLVEIQQNSNVTYRIDDFGRPGKDGKPRELHIDRAQDVLHFGPAPTNHDFAPHLGYCPYFTVDRAAVTEEAPFKGTVDEKSFLSILCVNGRGVLKCGQEEMAVKKGDSIFLPAGAGDYVLEGALEAILTTV